MAEADKGSSDSDGVLGRLGTVLSIIAGFGVPTYAFGLAIIAHQFQIIHKYQLSFPDSWEAVSLMPATSVIAYGADTLARDLVLDKIILLLFLMFWPIVWLKYYSTGVGVAQAWSGATKRSKWIGVIIPALVFLFFSLSCIGQEHVAQRKDLRHESQAPAFRSGERCRARRATPAARLTPDPDG